MVRLIQHVDFPEMFAPTPSAASVKTAVAVANEKGWFLWNLDIKQAFIQAHLDEAVYMRYLRRLRELERRSRRAATCCVRTPRG